MSNSVIAQPAVIGAGPVGRAVVDCLVSDGHAPILVTRSGTSFPGCTGRAADVTDANATAAAIDGADVVFHCAQPPYHRWPEEFPAVQAGVLGGAERAGAGVVAVENTYAYGRFTGAATEQTKFAPVSRKGRVRAGLAREFLDAHQTGRVQTVAVRASDFYGPHVLGSVYGSRFFGPLVAGKKPQMFGGLDARHTVAFVPDIARCMVTVAAAPELWGRAWHAPAPPAPTQREFLELAARAARTTPNVLVVPRWQLRIAGPFMAEAREQLEMLYEFEHDFIIDSSAITNATGLEATPLPDALDATITWFRGQG